MGKPLKSGLYKSDGKRPKTAGETPALQNGDVKPAPAADRPALQKRTGKSACATKRAVKNGNVGSDQGWLVVAKLLAIRTFDYNSAAGGWG